MKFCHVNFNINHLHYEFLNDDDRKIQFSSDQIQTKMIKLNVNYVILNFQRQDLFKNDEKAHVNFIQVESFRDDVSEKKVDDDSTTESNRIVINDDLKIE